MSDLLQVGVAATIVVIILREVFGFLKARRMNGAGEKPVEFWLMHNRQAAKEAVSEELATVREDLARVLRLVEQIARDVVVKRRGER